ncbi:MAG TPA: hypothetical protein VKS00_07655 [Candidatus Acidoferrales bacterium]|nr:hypothetical protein [Candidatus Acidoferrales bacterium]
MQIPESLSDRFPFLDALENDWQPAARWALVAWLIFYLLFLYQALRGQGPLLMIDLVFVPVHEGGHLLFRWFDQWLSIAGGTFLQLFAPFALAVYFAFQRHVTGTAVCAFFFFEQFLPIATYMADARAQALPLLAVGDGGYIIHDWNYLFASLGVLNHDTAIAATVRALGWLGMCATVAWLIYRSRATASTGHPSRIPQ